MRYEELSVGKLTAAPAKFVVGAEATNVINVSCDLQLKTPQALTFYLADDAEGLTPSSVAPTGGIAIGTDGALIESVANLAGTVITEADGTFDVDITDTGTPTFYLVVVDKGGLLHVSDAITFA